MPLHPDLLARLNKLAGSDKPEIFILPQLAGQRGSGRRGLSETFKKIMRKAGLDLQTVKGAGKRMISRRTFHALRHSFTSALANQNVSSELRMKLTGHNTEASIKNTRITKWKISAPPSTKSRPLAEFYFNRQLSRLPLHRANAKAHLHTGNIYATL